VWVVIPWFAYQLTRNREAALLAAAWACASAPLVHYAQTSRGYALQNVLIVLCAWSLHAEQAGARRVAYWQPWSLPWVAVLVLPTSVLFLTRLWLRLGAPLSRETMRGCGATKRFSAPRVPGAHCRCALGLLSGAWLFACASQFAAGTGNNWYARHINRPMFHLSGTRA